MTKNRWKLLLFLLTVSAIVCMVAFAGCNHEAEAVLYELKYVVAEGGQIIGITEQKIEAGADGKLVVADPYEGYRFVCWSDGLKTIYRQDKNAKSNLTYIAYFEAIKAEYMLRYTSGAGGCIEGEATQTVLERDNGAAVTAVPDEGYKFVKWSDGVKTAKRQDRSVKANKDVKAEFALLDYYTITYTAKEGGYIDGETEQTILEQNNGTTVTAVAEYGYRFIQWSDGITTANRQDLRVTDSKTLTAYFARIPTYTIKYTADEKYGHIEGKAIQNIIPGDYSKPVTAVANERYEFIGWSDGIKKATRRDLLMYADKEVEAEFRLVYFSHEYFANPEGGRIEGDTLQWIYKDELGTEVTAVPNEGYLFSSWSDGVKTPKRQDSNHAPMKIEAYFRKGIAVNYRVNKGIGGHIEGEAKQLIFQYSNSSEVKAVADEGYVFSGWSDGVATAERYDTELNNDFTMTAYFEPKEKTFCYDYCGATGNMSVQSVTVKRDDPKASVFAVPQKDGFAFGGWYADENCTVRITDEAGRLMYGYNTVTLETDTLYARWLDPNDDEPVFKILIIVVDEIDATLKLREDNTQSKRIHHKISMPERILCKQVAPRMSAYLNPWFFGKVKFEIDTYFTMQVVDTEDFYHDSETLDALRMKEVRDMYDKYDSLLTLFDLNDYDNEIKRPGVMGRASAKRGCVYLDEVLVEWALMKKNVAEQMMQGDETVEKSRWQVIETCLHEFTHTVDCRYRMGELYEFDYAIKDLFYDGIQDTYEITRRYLLCEAEVNGKMVGIPPTFWSEALWTKYPWWELLTLN